MDWRQLKRELQEQIKPRCSKTFQSDIFTSDNQHQCEIKSRQSATTKSQIFDQNGKQEGHISPNGKRVFKQKTILKSGCVLEQEHSKSPNRYRKPDHSPDYLFGENLSIAMFKLISAFKRESLKGSKIASPFKPAFDNVSAKDIGVKSMYQTNVFEEQQRKCILKLFDPFEDQVVDQKDQAFEEKIRIKNKKEEREKVTSWGKRVEDFSSNIFHMDSNQKKRMQTEYDSQNIVNSIFFNGQKFSDKEIEKLKRTNQNYSELFGLEYGKRGSVQQQVKQISNDVGWINIDSVRNNLDFGVKYYNPPKTFQTFRSRITDQRSVLDTHTQQYSSKIESRFTSNQNEEIRCSPILRSKRKDFDLVQLAKQQYNR